MASSYRGIPINTSKNTHETVMQMINQNTNSKIVDIPSGTGAFILRLKDNGYNNVLGIDIENIMQIEHSNFKQGDMTKPLPVENCSIDTLVCIDGIEHITNQFDFVRNVNRTLKKGGEFILSTPNISSLRSRWKWFLTGHHHKCNAPLDEKNPNPLHHISMISFPELRYMLHTSGFKIDEIKTNRVKLINWIYGALMPFIYLITSLAYYKAGKKDDTTEINREIKKTMFSKPILFGETLIIKGIKTEPIKSTGYKEGYPEQI